LIGDRRRRFVRRRRRWVGRIAFGATLLALSILLVAPQALSHGGGGSLDERLAARLRDLGFTGRVESTLEVRLGRAVSPKLADLGRLLWFDTITGLNDDNTCAGCHSPTNGFGDSQSIAIGIDNNGLVGPDRAGPRNMRRAPTVINTAFSPRLMWNSRFFSRSGDPFDNSAGFVFPHPEAESLSYLPHLLVAQAFIPPTERTEAAGFDFPGDNGAIRSEVAGRLDRISEYRRLFGRVFAEVRDGAPITFEMFARAIAEFEFSLTFANAPVDRFARGERDALSESEKRGVQCHAVSGDSNEMFSDFRDHAIGVPQIVPRLTNNTFDGRGANEDFGREDFTGDAADRYKFRTPPLRNAAVQAAFMHDGAFTSLEGAIRHHLDVFASARAYDPAGHGLPGDLAGPIGPLDYLLAAVDPLLAGRMSLTDREVADITAFVRSGLLDPRAEAAHLRKLVPKRLPSGRPALTFQFAETEGTNG
jgi:cytochrome c peroxidase